MGMKKVKGYNENDLFFVFIIFNFFVPPCWAGKAEFSVL